MTKNLLPPVLPKAAILFVAPIYLFLAVSRQAIHAIGPKGSVKLPVMKQSKIRLKDYTFFSDRAARYLSLH
jgi:hypothetical protein